MCAGVVGGGSDGIYLYVRPSLGAIDLEDRRTLYFVVLGALFVTLIPTTIGGLLSAIGVAGMSRMLQANVIATSGRAVEAAGDVDTLLLDKTGTITVGGRNLQRLRRSRVPYLRRYKQEQQVYDAQITPTTVGKHVAPHATEVAAMWAVLTRLKKPIPDRYPPEVKELVDQVTPVEKMHLYEEGAVPDRLSLAHGKELRKLRTDLYEESDAYPNYEGRSGASAREIKTALFNAAQHPDYRCLHALAVFEELEAICKDKSVYEFLLQEVVDGYHDHEEFVRAVQAEYLDRVDEEVRESMGLVSEGQYRELIERYVVNVSHWVKGEKIRNRHTGAMERVDEQRMAELEAIVMPRGEDAGEFRRGLISQIGAHKLDNPDAEMDYPRIFPDLFRHLRDHYFEERKRVLRRNKENVLKYLSEDRGTLSSREQAQVESTLQAMSERYGYCEHCAKDAILFLMRKRYG